MINLKAFALPFCLVISFFSTGIVSAQEEEQTLKGKVVNKDKLPVEFAHATLFKNDTILVKEMFTDSLGVFSFKAEKGNYKLILEQFGTEHFNQHLELNHDIDLGEIQIDESVMIEGVTISARKKLVERKVDRLVFNVENSVLASGGDLLGALAVTPGIQVRDNSISIAGKSSVAVMIDDKIVQLSGESLISFLKTMSADDIKSIEVITTPPRQI